jgi:catechol 2,3-dioxygenase-like lactoylglutathione lyase family enzyme
VNHIGFQVKSTAEAMARFQAAGLRTEPGGFPGQGWLMSPSDVRVEILQDPNLAIPIRGHHVHFNNADPLAQQAWYAKVFGAEPGKRGNFDAANITASSTVMNLTFTGVEAATVPTKGRAADHIAFSVDNLAAFLRGLQGQNVTIDQPLAMQANGRTGIAFIVDPWGARIELIDQNAGGGTNRPAGTAAAAPAAAGRMLRPRLITHVVADLDKSIAFYREGLDLEIASGPGPITGSALLHKAKATNPAATARQATLTIPGSNLSLQLIQFSGIEGKAFEQRLYDPGVTRFSIQVRDIDAAFEKVKDRVTVDTTSAGPVFTQRPRNDTRAVMMRDPDGFVFEFVQSGNPVQSDVPASSNIYNARSSLAIEDFDKAFAFYRDILGFTFANPPRDVNDAVLALEGTPRANARSTGGMPPGSNNMWVLWEFRDIERTKRVPNVQDPGASAITLEVENLPALLARMKASGVTVETPGGEAVTIDGRRAALVRSPDGLLVELVEP